MSIGRCKPLGGIDDNLVIVSKMLHRRLKACCRADKRLMVLFVWAGEVYLSYDDSAAITRDLARDEDYLRHVVGKYGTDSSAEQMQNDLIEWRDSK